MTGSIAGDNPWDPGQILGLTGDLKATGVSNAWVLELDYPASVNNTSSGATPSRPDKVHKITIIEPSAEIPGKLAIEIDRTGETTEHNLAEERWELLLFGVLSEQGVNSNLITNPDTAGVYRWLAQEATAIDLEDTLDGVPGSQSIILK